MDIFGERVVFLVEELTDQFTKQNYPNLNRVQRKELERERLSNISYEANGFLFHSENLKVPEGTSYFEINKAVILEPIKVKKP